MIRPSPELLAITRRWFDAGMKRETGALRNFMSDSACLRFVGTAQNEVWAGPAVRTAIGDHYNEMPAALRREECLAEAFETAEAGWAFFTNNFWFEGREDPVELRTGLIFTLENGSWRIVQRHTSLGTPNQALLGYEHTAIQALLDAVQTDLTLTQREGLASVMFTDILNSSPLTATLGDRAWSTLIADHFFTLRRIIEKHGGQFVKSLGDGTLSSFTSARAALTAARDIQTMLAGQTTEPLLSIRIGLHTGDVVQSDGDFFGTVVNKSARITTTAEPGEICVSDITRAMVGYTPDFAFSAPYTVTLKGLDGAHQIHKLEWRK